MDKLSVLVLSDSPLPLVEKILINFAGEQQVEVAINYDSNPTLLEDRLNMYNPNLLLLTSSLASRFNFQVLGPYLKDNYPRVHILVLINSDIRSALRLLLTGIDDMVLVSDPHFEVDFVEALTNIYDLIKKENRLRRYYNSLYNPENYPVAIYTLEGNGIQLLYKDFDVFPDSENRYEKITDEFIMNLGLHLGLLVGQGHAYHESCYFVPAGNSSEYSILVFSFRIDNPEASQARLKLGYYLFCLFIKNEYFREFPSISQLQYLINDIKELLPDSLTLRDPDGVLGLKFSLLNKIMSMS